MIKQFSPLTDRLFDAEIQMKAYHNLPCLIFACVEKEKNGYRVVSYWDIDDDRPMRGQRFVPFFMVEG